jgi:predicted nuclease of predicted toxin-antitoxin system
MDRLEKSITFGQKPQVSKLRTITISHSQQILINQLISSIEHQISELKKDMDIHQSKIRRIILSLDI